jgi:hypothetical protein
MYKHTLLDTAHFKAVIRDVHRAGQGKFSLFLTPLHNHAGVENLNHNHKFVHYIRRVAEGRGAVFANASFANSE